MDGAPRDITNDDGDCGDSGGRGINDVNFQTIMESITLAIN